MSNFELLHESIRRWIWQQGWTQLRDVQEHAIPLLLPAKTMEAQSSQAPTPKRDLIIMAPTAGGKTEAAFLPIASSLAEQQENKSPPPGFSALYLSPLRALINDQAERLESLCSYAEIPVTPWHADVPASVKSKARRTPAGILLTTPESFESMLTRRGKDAARLFGNLQYVVIDEMHVFLNSPRGKQLQSLLHRLEVAASIRPARIGLSATLADAQAGQDFLRPLNPKNVEVLTAPPSGTGLRLQLRGHVYGQDRHKSQPLPDESALIQHLFETHRNSRSLIFAGARGMVEDTTVTLNDMAERQRLPAPFHAHHGSLSREHREEAERCMKDLTRPASIVCTTTLELGIDVGDIEAVAQLGPGHSVSGLRQRIGRSGRRDGQAGVLRIYTKELALEACRSPIDELRVDTVQAIAMLNLMLAEWNEPPETERLHLSTFLHQIMGLIGQYGGLKPVELWTMLGKSQLFPAVDVELFKRLLKRMAAPDVQLLEQAPDGTLLPGAEGEKLLESREIFAVFQTPEEFTVTTSSGRNVGRIPGDSPFFAEQLILLAGQRWKIVDVDKARKVLTVQPAFGGGAPRFSGERIPPHTGIVAEMRRVYESLTCPPWLDSTARQLLAEARTAFDRLGLRHSPVIHAQDTLFLFPWVGEKEQTALLMTLSLAGIQATGLGLAISVPEKQELQLRQELTRLAQSQLPDPIKLAEMVENRAVEKFDHYLGDELLNLSWARDRIKVESLPEVAQRILEDFCAPLLSHN